jgi:hypothetical protein
MDRNAAKHINSVLLRQASELKDVIALAKQSCGKDEFEVFLESTSHSIAIIFDVLDKVYEQYPDLKPRELH